MGGCGSGAAVISHLKDERVTEEDNDYQASHLLQSTIMDSPYLTNWVGIKLDPHRHFISLLVVS